MTFAPISFLLRIEAVYTTANPPQRTTSLHCINDTVVHWVFCGGQPQQTVLHQSFPRRGAAIVQQQTAQQLSMQRPIGLLFAVAAAVTPPVASLAARRVVLS